MKFDPFEICIFLHIPKCAGTSIRESIKNQVPKDFCTTPSYGTELNIPVDQYISLFEHAPPEAFDKKIIAGHLLFGVHRQTKKVCTYTTIVRHPVDRLWSQYCYMRQLGEQDNYCRGCVTLVNSEMSFESFVSLPELLPLGNFGCMPNLQTFMIAGEQSPTMLNQAKENLERFFSIVGIQEQFECFRKRLAQHLKISIPSKWLLKKDNRLSNRILPTGLRKKIEQRDVVDMELYDHIKGIL